MKVVKNISNLFKEGESFLQKSVVTGTGHLMKNPYFDEIYIEELSDKRVWQELRADNINALKTLFLRHQNHLYNYGIKLSGDRHLVEDCIHDLFFRIWERRLHLGNVRSVKSYLWMSFRRDLIKSMNSNVREVLTDSIQNYSPEIRFNSEELIIQRKIKTEYGSALERALNQLPARQKEAIFLKFFNGMGYDEIQQIMSINYQTARNYVHGGLKTLKDYFDNAEEELLPYKTSLLILCLLVV